MIEIPEIVNLGVNFDHEYLKLLLSALAIETVQTNTLILLISKFVVQSKGFIMKHI